VEIIASEDKNANSIFSGLVLAMLFFCYNVNVQYNTSFKEEDMILPILNIICGSKELRRFEEDWEGHCPSMS
jgi:hypothetical protein